MSLQHKPVSEMRAAAKAWRENYKLLANHLIPENMSLHDRVDDLINEIERLRRTSGERT